MKKIVSFLIVCSIHSLVFAQYFPFDKTSSQGKRQSFQAEQGFQNKNVSNVMQRLDSVRTTVNGQTNYIEGYWFENTNRSMGYYAINNNGSGMMDTTSKEIYVYNANNQIEEIEVWEFDGVSLQLYSRQQMVYDNNGNIIESTMDFWDNVLNDWTPGQQIFSTYNAQNQLTQEITQTWDLSVLQWINTYRRTQTYGPTGITLGLTEMYDVTSSSWFPNSQVLYTYNVNGDMSAQENQYYDLAFAMWIQNDFTAYQYNSSYQLESTISSLFDPSIQSYTPYSQTNYVYDTFGNNIQQINLDPNDPFNPYYRQNFNYDNTYAFSDLILAHNILQDVSNLFTHKLISLNTETWDGVQWLQEANADLYYSQQSVNAVPTINTQDIVVFPNPAVDYLTIQTSGLNIPAVLLDQNGRCIQRQNISGTEQVDISHLSVGIYHWIINGKSYAFVK